MTIEDNKRAALLARIADLERALESIIEGVENQSMTLTQCAGAAWEVLP